MRTTLAAALAALAFATAYPAAAGDPDFTYLTDDPRAGCGYWESLQHCRHSRGYDDRYYYYSDGEWRRRDSRYDGYDGYDRYDGRYDRYDTPRGSYRSGYRDGYSAGYDRGYGDGSRNGGRWKGIGDGIGNQPDPRFVDYCYERYRDYDPRTNTWVDRDGQVHACR